MNELLASGSVDDSISVLDGVHVYVDGFQDEVDSSKEVFGASEDIEDEVVLIIVLLDWSFRFCPLLSFLERSTYNAEVPSK